MTATLPSNTVWRAGRAVLLTTLLLLAVALLAEGLLRLKLRGQQDFNVYADAMMETGFSPLWGRAHAPDRSFVFRSIAYRTNEWALRGGPVQPRPAPGQRRILLIGNSIAQGLGLAEDDTLSAGLTRRFAADRTASAGAAVEVLNAGVPGFTAQASIEYFLAKLAPLAPTDILVLATPLDGRPLDTPITSWILHNSRLAGKIYGRIARLTEPQGRDEVLAARHVLYDGPDAPGTRVLAQEFDRLATYARSNGVSVTVALVPDLINLAAYPEMLFVDDQFRRLAEDHGFRFIPLYPAFAGGDAVQMLLSPTDPHPNAGAVRRIMDLLYPALAAQD
ncbi:SGNH/GDSL hydrolase family protein [Oleisolibacter albus]|uniref:SGNH/GDSL hydrolase family protein n=1 Tax=Oleisolibacter albus TaxID=2171757 RepID=UPI0012D7D7C5|nr:hypothetical protein [Oleisolibacter albus]